MINCIMSKIDHDKYILGRTVVLTAGLDD